MHIITATALANLKKNKSRNILIGIAIALTALLITLVPIVGLGVMNVQFATTNELYPTYHAMFRDISQETATKLDHKNELEPIGLREDPGYLVSDDADIIMCYYDATAAKLNKMKLAEGSMPVAEDEIVVSKGLLAAMGLTGKMGDTVTLPYQVREDGGLGLQKEKVFKIVGMFEDSKDAADKKVYASLVSKAFLDKEIPETQRSYRAYLRVANSNGVTTDALEAQIKTLATTLSIQENNVVLNGEYLLANYVDPAVYAGIALILLVIIIAGVLTIYCIYYVSMMNRIQEYGKLKAIGATKKQIRKLVLREGLAVAVIAVPIGVMLGSITGYIMVRVISVSKNVPDTLRSTMARLLEEHRVPIIQPFIIALAIVVSFITVYFSLLKPMKMASKITTIEALRFHGADANKKKTRKGYAEINTRKLTISNLARNKKRTAITILTLGLTGVLFMAVATLIACMNPADRAKEEVRRDYAIYLDSEDGNKMNPERELQNIQQNNPLNPTFKQTLLSIDGVEKIEEKQDVRAALEEITEEGKPLSSSIIGIDDSSIAELQKTVTKGTVNLEELKKGTSVILCEGWITEGPGADLQVGDTLHFTLMDGDELIPKELTIVAIAAPNNSLTNYSSFAMPAKTLQAMCDTPLTATFDITVEKGKEAIVEKALNNIVAEQNFLGLKSYADSYKSMAEAIALVTQAAYGLLAVLGIVGILNLINTMINSVYIRRKELGMLQAIGLSNRQLLGMLQMEGLFYTGGTLALSLILGSLIGYGCFLGAKANYIMNITTYHYPLVPTIILIITVLVIQVLLTHLVNNNFNKQSLIERVRFSD